MNAILRKTSHRNVLYVAVVQNCTWNPMSLLRARLQFPICTVGSYRRENHRRVTLQT